MPWSKWELLTSENVSALAPEKPGAYKIALPDDKFFVIRKPQQKHIWVGIVSSAESQGETRIDIVYLGMSEEQTIKARLSQHLSDRGGIVWQLKQVTALHFKYLTSEDAGYLELNQYKEFVDNPFKACPPGDGNSKECSGVGGVYLETYIRTPDGKLKFLC